MSDSKNSDKNSKQEEALLKQLPPAKEAAELHDEEFFKQPPTAEDCPICFLRLPYLETGVRYMTCCGKQICCGCDYAPLYDDQGNEVDGDKCVFCRATPPKSEEEDKERHEKRIEANNATAMHNLGVYYSDGTDGYPQDNVKALELWHRAAELGNAYAYASIGYAYDNGDGVEVDKKKANHDNPTKHTWERSRVLKGIKLL